MKTEGYYKFLAPLVLFRDGVEITKENINKFVQAELYGVVQQNTILEINGMNDVNISEISAPIVEKIIAPQSNLIFDKYNASFGYNTLKHIDVLSLSSGTGFGLEETSLSALETLILRANYLVVGLYGILHDSKITNGNGNIYVMDDLFELYKLHYSDTPSILKSLRKVSEL